MLRRLVLYASIAAAAVFVVLGLVAILFPAPPGVRWGPRRSDEPPSFHDPSSYDPSSYDGSFYDGSFYDGSFYDGSSYDDASCCDGSSYDGSSYDDGHFHDGHFHHSHFHHSHFHHGHFHNGSSWNDSFHNDSSRNDSSYNASCQHTSPNADVHASTSERHNDDPGTGSTGITDHIRVSRKGTQRHRGHEGADQQQPHSGSAGVQ